MKRHGNLINKITDPKNIERAYHMARRGKGWQRGVRRFEKSKLQNLRIIRRILRNGTFTTSNYTKKTVREPKKRTIYKLPFCPDRIIQHAILQVVAPIWDAMLIDQTYACRPNKGMHQASTLTMKHVRTYKYCLKCDISKFYPSINHDILLAIIKRKIKCKPTLALLEDIIRSFPGHTNVPIGNYTSQWFGNLYMNELDQWIRHTKKFSAYIRYCDDFVIFSDSKVKLHDLQKEIQTFLYDRLRLRFSKASVFPVSQGVDFLGYRHFTTHKLLRKRTARRVMRRMKHLPRLLQEGKISPDRYRGSLASTRGWLRWANTYNLRISARLDELEAVLELYEKEH